MQLLESLKRHRSELALIVDEYGEIGGMITLSDVMSALVGDVTVIDEEPVSDAVQREDNSWLLDGGMTIDRFREIFDTEVRFPEEDSGTYHTLAGFVLARLGHIPSVSEQFEWDNYRFEVVDMDRNRIDRLLVQNIYTSNVPEENSRELDRSA
jgi:putative hemolysin